jgi:hypothetical protein
MEQMGEPICSSKIDHFFHKQKTNGFGLPFIFGKQGGKNPISISASKRTFHCDIPSGYVKIAMENGHL